MLFNAPQPIWGGARRDWTICTQYVMPKEATVLSDELRRRARALDRFVDRMELLHGQGLLPRNELHYAYAGAFITFYTETEGKLEELFLGLLMGRVIAPRANIRPLVTIRSDAVARRIIRGDRAFVDWLPYERSTRERAKAFFAGGAPFVGLVAVHRNAFQRASVLRNAIAHRSRSASRKFASEFVEGKALRPSERKPTGYLRGFHAPGQRRINLQFAEVVAALDALCR